MRKGAAALWRRYHSDPAFKETIDRKLKASRSREGARSLLSIGETAFKGRLAASASSQARPTYRDSMGNRLRSRLELRLAETLQSHGISHIVESRFVSGRAFYPDFVLAEGRRIIEVDGHAVDWYWDKTSEKIKSIAKNHPRPQLAIVTQFLRMMKWATRCAQNHLLYSLSTGAGNTLVPGIAGVHKK